jgi:hypothetical protein
MGVSPMQHRRDADATAYAALGTLLWVPPTSPRECDPKVDEIEPGRTIGFVSHFTHHTSNFKLVVNWLRFDNEDRAGMLEQWNSEVMGYLPRRELGSFRKTRLLGQPRRNWVRLYNRHPSRRAAIPEIGFVSHESAGVRGRVLGVRSLAPEPRSLPKLALFFRMAEPGRFGITPSSQMV